MNLRATLDDLDALVAASKPATKDLAPFLRELRPLVHDAHARRSPTSPRSSTSPGADNDLDRRDAQAARASQRVAEPGVRALDHQALKKAQPVLEFVRPYTPDLVGWFRDFGQGAANYDANGHYARIQPIFNAFQFTDNPAGGTLTPIPPSAAPRRPADRPAAALPGRGQPAAGGRLGAASATPAAPSTATRAWCRPAHEARRSPSPPSSSLAAAVLVVVATGASDDGGSYQVRAIFDNAGFVIPGEDVKIAGVKVGKIDSLDVTPDNKAAVVLRHRPTPATRTSARDAELHDPPAVADRRAVRRVQADPAARRRHAQPPPKLRKIEHGPGQGPVPAAGRRTPRSRSTST